MPTKDFQRGRPSSPSAGAGSPYREVGLEVAIALENQDLISLQLIWALLATRHVLTHLENFVPLR